MRAADKISLTLWGVSHYKATLSRPSNTDAKAHAHPYGVIAWHRSQAASLPPHADSPCDIRNGGKTGVAHETCAGKYKPVGSGKTHQPDGLQGPQESSPTL